MILVYIAVSIYVFAHHLNQRTPPVTCSVSTTYEFKFYSHNSLYIFNGDTEVMKYKVKKNNRYFYFRNSFEEPFVKPRVTTVVLATCVKSNINFVIVVD